VRFVDWYRDIEPTHPTGLNQTVIQPSQLPVILKGACSTCAGELSDDAEALHIIGLIAHLYPWCIGEDVPTWEARSKACQVRYRELASKGIDSARFEGRGTCRDYFADQAAIESG
jgi:hypothetical protein